MPLRLTATVLLALSVSLPMAALSIAKVLLFVVALSILIADNFTESPQGELPPMPQ